MRCQPMPSDPARAADDEAMLRMLWLWVGYVAYDETLSESGEEAVKRFLKRAWPKYHGSRITRSLLETWVQYARTLSMNETLRHATADEAGILAAGAENGCERPQRAIGCPSALLSEKVSLTCAWPL